MDRLQPLQDGQALGELTALTALLHLEDRHLTQSVAGTMDGTMLLTVAQIDGYQVYIQTLELQTNPHPP